MQVTLSGEGIAPALALGPLGHDFGSQTEGTRSDASAFAVRNDGTTAVELGAVAVVGADPDQFPLAGDECTGASLAPGQECAVRVRFTPDGAGTRSATLRVGGEGGVLTASLSGTGTAAGTASSSVTSGAAAAAAAATPARAGASRPSRRRIADARRRFARNTVLASARARCPRLRAVPCPRHARSHSLRHRRHPDHHRRRRR
jgi:hypothetical protein